jgi:antitoxin component YwqK of YwqJK toxin-antitoxin module
MHHPLTTIVSLALALCLAGCGNSNLENPKTYQKALQESLDEDELETKQVGEEKLLCKRDDQTPYTGWFVARWNEESIRILAHYRNGRKDGPFFQYNEWLAEQEKGHYKNGNKDGFWTEWDLSGATLQEGHYKNGKKDGIWTQLDEDDNESQITYMNGEKVGP